MKELYAEVELKGPDVTVSCFAPVSLCGAFCSSATSALPEEGGEIGGKDVESI